MEESLVAWLLADTALVALVEQRIHWSVLPQGGTGPSVALHRITGIRDYHMQGPSGLVRSLVQIDCWAPVYGDAIAVSRAVRNSLSGVGRDDIETFQFVSLLNERQDFDSGAETAERFHRVSLDFELWHSE